ncbi:hypothetical protein [Methanosarcina barkeri]|uniref:hypothetical protein n=1 Tax=Methanosarcina barkeri TaxID=2208 RepID=UPI001FB38175|nr:hypothetical protein [Methanosarcina barkeri]
MEYPAFITAIPATRSMYSLPSTSLITEPFALSTTRGYGRAVQADVILQSCSIISLAFGPMVLNVPASCSKNQNTVPLPLLYFFPGFSTPCTVSNSSVFS